ncbi:MAG: diguanylate cyclase [Solirubrobacteraceae bacterium]
MGQGSRPQLDLCQPSLAYERLHQCSREDVAVKASHDVFSRPLVDADERADIRALETGEPVSGERQVALADGSTRTFLIGCSPLRDRDANVYGLCAVATDITARTQMERALQEARQLFEQAFQHAPIGMALVGLDGRFIRVNEAFTKMMGYESNVLTTKTFSDITHPYDVAEGLELHQRLLSGEIDDFQLEKRYLDAKGHTIWGHLSASLVRTPQNEPPYVIAQVQDISDRKLMEKRLRHLADHDSLTGLPNRRFFEQQLAIQTGRCQRYGENATLLLIDLDGFKQINDRHGHRAGDDLLKGVAQAIRTRIRATDTAARIGGDEFAVLLSIAGAQGSAIADEIRQAIADIALQVRSGVVQPTASIGTAFLDEQTGDPEDALGDADAAMYLDKARYRTGPLASTVRRLRRVPPAAAGLRTLAKP